MAQDKAVGTGMRYNLEVSKDKVNKLSGLVLRAFMRASGRLNEAKAFFQWKCLVQGHDLSEEVVAEQVAAASN